MWALRPFLQTKLPPYKLWAAHTCWAHGSPILSAVVCVLGIVHKPMLGLWTTQTVSAHTGHSNPLLKPNSKEAEGSRLPSDREYGKYPRKGVKKPERSSDSGTDLLCDLGQSLPLSGLQFPPLSRACRMKKEKGGRMHAFCSWDSNEYFLLAAQNPTWLTQGPAGILVLRLTWAGTSWFHLPAQESCISERRVWVILMDSFLCVIRLAMLEAASRVEAAFPSLGRVRLLAPAGADGRALGL